MNEDIEKRNNNIKNNNKLSDEDKRIQTKKLFQPIPLRNSIIPSYITIDTNCILDLFKEKVKVILVKILLLIKTIFGIKFLELIEKL